MKTKCANKYRFYPTDEQAKLLTQTFGCVRFVCNPILRCRTDEYYNNGNSITYNVASKQLTELKKNPDCQWLKDISSVPVQQSLRHQQTAFKNSWEGRAKYPAFKKKQAKQSTTFNAYMKYLIFFKTIIFCSPLLCAEHYSILREYTDKNKLAIYKKNTNFYCWLHTEDLGEVYVESEKCPEIKKSVLLKCNDKKQYDYCVFIETYACMFLIPFIPNPRLRGCFLLTEKTKVAMPKISEQEGDITYTVTVTKGKTTETGQAITEQLICTPLNGFNHEKGRKLNLKTYDFKMPTAATRRGAVQRALSRTVDNAWYYLTYFWRVR